jgi:N-acyl-D-aspartate/D-glutamate deacylase
VIAAIDRSGSIPPHAAARVIDASGKIVAPGVIDPHTHYDAQVHWDPYCTNSGWHGVTTVGVGNCGFGFAPCAPELRDRYMRMMENTEQVPYGAMREALAWNWVSYPEWAAEMQKRPKGINLASYLPLNSLLIYVMGIEAAKSRPATEAERARMRELLHQAMDAGAIGFAFSHLQQWNSHKDIDGSPMPTDSMAVEEAYNLATVLRDRGEGVIQALCQLPGAVDNHAVAEELARRSQRPIIHNVIAAFDSMPGEHTKVLRWLDAVEREGLEIYSQALCFRAWNEVKVADYNAWDFIPAFQELSNEPDVAAKIAKARDSRWRDRVKAVYSPQTMFAAGGMFETWMLSDAMGASRYEAYEGRLLGDVAAERREHPVDLFLDIAVATELQADFRQTDAISKDPEKILPIMKHPRVLPGTSDGGAHVKFYCGGHFSTDLIMWLAREEKLMTLEELHHKCSSVPARAMRLARRGEIREGWAADLVVYDFEKIGYDRRRYQVAYDLPGGDWRRTAPAQGISWILVNGEVTFRNNNCQGTTPGRLLGSTRH